MIVKDAAGQEWVRIVCPHCRTDLSKVSLGRVVETPAGPLIQTWWRVACPECNASLIPVTQPSKVVRPLGPLS